MHGGGNGLDAKEYARVRATVCTTEWTADDRMACFAMYALYIITHLPPWAIGTFTDTNVYLILSVYPLYVFTVGYMARGLFAKYTWDTPKMCTKLLNKSPFLLAIALYIIGVPISPLFSLPTCAFLPVDIISSFIETQNETAWKAYVAEHANRRCYFHADCLCACDTCRTPVDAASRHPGSEKTGVDVSAYLAAAKVCTFDAWTVHKVSLASVLLPFAFSGLIYMLYAMPGPGLDLTLSVLHPAAHLLQVTGIVFLVQIDRVTRADLARHPFVYGPFIMCMFAWNVLAVSLAHWVLAGSRGPPWKAFVYAAAHLLGHAFLYVFALAGIVWSCDSAEKQYMQSMRRKECTMHPECLCSCDRCGGPSAPAPVERRLAARSRAQ